jgi:molecular chaperone GrpE
MAKHKIPIDNDTKQNNDKKEDDNKNTDKDTKQSEPAEISEANDKPVEAEKEAGEAKDITIQALEERCRAAEERAEAEHDTFLRTLAEYNNFRRRMLDEIEQSKRFGTEDLIARLLPLIDSFERGIESANASKDFDALYDGIMITLRQLMDILAKEGLKPIETENAAFDPNFHEAVMREENNDLPEGTIIQELRKGYTLGDKVIRPSMVKVSHKSE